MYYNSFKALLDVSHLAERAPGPRFSSLPWGRRSPTPELWAETTVVPSLSWAARAAGRGAGPAPPLLPRNADGSGRGTNSINNRWPSVMADIWKGSWTHSVFMTSQRCLLQVQAELFLKRWWLMPRTGHRYFTVTFQIWSNNLFLISLKCCKKRKRKRKISQISLFHFSAVPSDQWQRLSWLWWVQRCGSSVLWPWLWAPAPESQISSPSAGTARGSPWAPTALQSSDHKPLWPKRSRGRMWNANETSQSLSITWLEIFINQCHIQGLTERVSEFI